MSRTGRIMLIAITAWGISGLSSMSRLVEAGAGYERRQWEQIGKMPTDYRQALAELINATVQVHGVQVIVKGLVADASPGQGRDSLRQAAEQMYIATRAIDYELVKLKASSEKDPATRLEAMRRSRSLSAQINSALSAVQLPAEDAVLRNVAAALERIASAYSTP